MNRSCKNCKSYIIGEWHASLGGGKQLGGSCVMLKELLEISNAFLWSKESLHVQESFCCSAWSKKDD
jgi:hypothetical protein